MANYGTSLVLRTKWFNLIRSGEKTIEVREQRNGILPGETVRFMKGCDPDNGAVLRRVSRVKRTTPSKVSEEELRAACVDREWLEEYADGDFVYLLFLEVGSE